MRNNTPPFRRVSQDESPRTLTPTPHPRGEGTPESTNAPSGFPLALWERGTEGVRAHRRNPGFTPGATQFRPLGSKAPAAEIPAPQGRQSVAPGVNPGMAESPRTLTPTPLVFPGDLGEGLPEATNAPSGLPLAPWERGTEGVRVSSPATDAPRVSTGRRLPEATNAPSGLPLSGLSGQAGGGPRGWGLTAATPGSHPGLPNGTLKGASRPGQAPWRR